MKKYITECDSGALKVGNDSFTMLIRNGYGDGEMTVRIMEAKEQVSPEATYFTHINGKDINIYAYDGENYRGNEVVATITGRYAVYYKGGDHHGNVYLKKVAEYRE